MGMEQVFTHLMVVSRHFTTNTKIGMVGVNVPIPVPMAFHSFEAGKIHYMVQIYSWNRRYKFLYKT